MNDSIFTKIIKGEIPAHKVYEDDNTLAFLDIDPISEGHVLVVPKKEIEFVWDLEQVDYADLMETVRKVARRVREVVGKPYVSIRVVGTDVPHAHVHVIPFTTTKELHRDFDAAPNEPDHAALAVLAEKLKF
jgi:histidine triad (HIT) family protein